MQAARLEANLTSQTSSFAATAPTLFAVAKWFWITRKDGLAKPLATALERVPIEANTWVGVYHKLQDRQKWQMSERVTKKQRASA